MSSKSLSPPAQAPTFQVLDAIDGQLCKTFQVLDAIDGQLCNQEVVVWLLHFWEARNFKKGNIPMGVELLLLDAEETLMENRMRRLLVDGDLLSWTRKFKELLENRLGWEFKKRSFIDGICFDEDDEYAPVVEMLDESHGDYMAT